MCKYLLKEDKNPTVWGEERLEVIRERAGAAAGKHRGPDLVKLLREKDCWDDVMRDDQIGHLGVKTLKQPLGLR